MGLSKACITHEPKMYRGIGDVSQLPMVQSGDFACALFGEAGLWKPIHETANNTGLPVVLAIFCTSILAAVVGKRISRQLPAVTHCHLPVCCN